MSSPILSRTLIIAAAMLVFTTVSISTYAAGSGGGGGGGGFSNNAPSLSPEQLSKKAFRSGIKARDRALKQEAKAAKASSAKARDKALAKAQKAYKKAVKKQGEAVRLFPQNYKAANELGFALRKTGDYRKAIGAYNFALEINPNFHQATEYRGEAFLALGMLDQAKQAYLVLFRNDRELANQLMSAIDTWLANKDGGLSPAESEFATWVDERKRMAEITNDLSLNNLRTW